MHLSRVLYVEPDKARYKKLIRKLTPQRRHQPKHAYRKYSKGDNWTWSLSFVPKMVSCTQTTTWTRLKANECHSYQVSTPRINLQVTTSTPWTVKNRQQDTKSLGEGHRRYSKDTPMIRVETMDLMYAIRFELQQTKIRKHAKYSFTTREVHRNSHADALEGALP